MSIIETERLVLRPHRAEDFDDLAAMWADPDVTRFIGGRPSTSEESWARLLRYGGLWSLLGFGYWAVRERAGGRFVGEVGFADFRRGLGFDGAPEGGWILAPWAQGKGFAGEAVRAALAWADARGWARSVCIIDPDNVPSLRLADAAGYRKAGRITYKDHPVVLLERLKQSQARPPLQGWSGNDALVGGAGKDTLTGGAGADRFYFRAVTDSAVGADADRITDFSHAQADRIDLHLIDASTAAAGDQAFSFIGTGLYTGVAGQLRYAVSGGVTTIAGDVNGDKVSDFHIQLTGSIALVAADFVL